MTLTGVGTLVAQGKRQIEVEGKTDSVVRRALRAQFALVHAFRADYLGNLAYALTSRNFNPVMAMAADTVIVTAENIVPVGVIAPDRCTTPALLVDYLIQQTGDVAWTRRPSSPGASPELGAGATLVNLGIGMPTLGRATTSSHGPERVLPIGKRHRRHAAPPAQGLEDDDLTDAGGVHRRRCPAPRPSIGAMSFGLIRGGHLDVTVLGGLQVDEHGRLANWMVPGRMVPGMGGAMDLVTGAKRVIVAMSHTLKGKPKIVPQCTLPLTSARPVNLVVTEMAVIEPTDAGLALRELAPGVTLRAVLEATSARLIVGENTPEMAFA